MIHYRYSDYKLERKDKNTGKTQIKWVSAEDFYKKDLGTGWKVVDKIKNVCW